MKKDLSPTVLPLGPVEIYLARHFGFCYGVENAIEISFRTIEENPGKNIFLLSEMIHNPQVNSDLQNKGVRFLQDTAGKQLIPFENLSNDDIVLIPAFGTTLQIEKELRSTGIQIEKYNTTCPFVEKVWNRSEQIAGKGYSIVIHGKPKHEETRATFSHASSNAPSVVVNDMQEAVILGRYITNELPSGQFFEDFRGRHSPGFNPSTDLGRIGVVNQTTQLATDTQAISDYLRTLIQRHFNLRDEQLAERFADTRDTLCYATNDNQTAMTALLEVSGNLAIVAGGYNSSNTTHLVELSEQKLPTYFIDSSDKLLSRESILHYDYHSKHERITSNYLDFSTPVKILMTSGASCPDAVVEKIIRKLAVFFDAGQELDEWAAKTS